MKDEVEQIIILWYGMVKSLDGKTKTIGRFGEKNNSFRFVFLYQSILL